MTNDGESKIKDLIIKALVEQEKRLRNTATYRGNRHLRCQLSIDATTTLEIVRGFGCAKFSHVLAPERWHTVV